MQKQVIHSKMKTSQNDVVLMQQHDPVYTIGRGGSMDNVKFDVHESLLLRVDRGGEVTYHGPGQLVVYPILDLRYYKKDLHWYLRRVEQVVIDTLKDVGVSSHRIDGLTGVWSEGCKIAAVGTHASKWITMHGFAINVHTDLAAFEKIVPCGIRDRKVGSIHEQIPDIHMSQVQSACITALGNVFNMDIQVLENCYPDKRLL